MDHQSFYAGTCFDAYRHQGAHREEGDVVFRTFAPSAVRVSVIGDWNGWTETPMEKEYDGNFWVCHVGDGLPDGTRYKYRIWRRDGSFRDHCDPYGFGMELRPGTASVLRTLEGFPFGDQAWMAGRTDRKNGPLNIYELHLGSWKRKADGSWYSYTELIPMLIPYLLENGFDCVEFMPLSEHPCDESWGYQNTGFFSPTSRYGTARELMALVDACHRASIAVILDFVPVHFAVDDYALWNYDGTALYEYPHPAVGYSEWGSCNFMHARGEVRSFLQSAAHYWLEEYHFDGLRMDAVRNLIYWQGNPERGENQCGLTFLREMNRGLKERHPTAMLIAEDSSAHPGITAPVEAGGLGFDYKWDLGWMHDTLCYFRMPQEERKKGSDALTFSMDYYFNERYLLPLSHDEVVHGKASMMQKMEGLPEGKFPQARAFYLYMFAHPGKKLNFMGNELGQLTEWSEGGELPWALLEQEEHRQFQRFFRDLNLVYHYHPALWAGDYGPKGFRWLAMEEETCLFAIERQGRGERVVFTFNFSREPGELTLELGEGVKLQPLLDSDNTVYGGGSLWEEQPLEGEKGCFQLSAPPCSGRCWVVTEE